MSSVAEDVKAINRQIFVLAKQLSKDNPDLAATVTGLTPQVLKKLGEATLEDIESLSGVGVIYFQPRITEQMFERVHGLRGIARNHYIASVVPV